jgi:fructose-1,6-bisphosphatase II
MTQHPPRNLGLDLVRATEAAALHAGRWMGLGKRNDADRDATAAMFNVLDTLDMAGYIVVGEEGKLGQASPLRSGQTVGSRHGPAMDVVVDPIDGRNLLAQGKPGAMSVAAVAPRGSMWSPTPAVYMEKIVVDRRAAHALVPECMDAPIAWTLALIARVTSRSVRDLIVFVLERRRHADIIEEIRAAGARVMLRSDGDIAGALMAASVRGGADILLGVGGVSEGVIAACAVKSLGGAMLGRLAPQSAAERASVVESELDTRRILTCDELITSNEIFFAATGITDGPLLRGVLYEGNAAETESLILRSETHTRRTIHAEHWINE